jgi:hypothetical protein
VGYSDIGIEHIRVVVKKCVHGGMSQTGCGWLESVIIRHDSAGMLGGAVRGSFEGDSWPSSGT